MTAVTAEILNGSRGIGRLRVTPTQTGDSALTIAIALVLSVVGLMFVAIAELTRATHALVETVGTRIKCGPE